MKTFFQSKIIIVLDLLFEWSRLVANDTFIIISNLVYRTVSIHTFFGSK